MLVRRALVAFFFWWLIWQATGLSAAVQAPARKTILVDVFTTAQASRSGANCLMYCDSCHSDDLTGRSAPALKGPQFIDNWREYGLDALFIYIKDNMPRGKEKLGEQTYIEILTHIL